MTKTKVTTGDLLAEPAAGDGLSVLWNGVEKTDPAYTKYVDQRGGYHAIDAYYRIKRATQLWGPLGGKWWVDATDEVVPTAQGSALFLVRAELHHPQGDHPVIAYGCWSLFTEKREDDDAPKKALTGAISKALSYLGFSADVHLGMFDDAEYVNKRKRESLPRATSDLARKIEDLSAKLKGMGAADYVDGVLRKAGVGSIESMELSDAQRWAAKLERDLAIEKKEG